MTRYSAIHGGTWQVSLERLTLQLAMFNKFGAVVLALVAAAGGYEAAIAAAIGPAVGRFHRHE